MAGPDESIPTRETDFGCCARAVSDHIAAVPPRTVMKSLRRI
jgi:hypothetical protein